MSDWEKDWQFWMSEYSEHKKSMYGFNSSQSFVLNVLNSKLIALHNVTNSHILLTSLCNSAGPLYLHLALIGYCPQQIQ